MGVKCLSQGHNDALPSSETELRVDNLVVANLHSHPLSVTAASWDESVSAFSKDTTAPYAVCSLHNHSRHSQHGKISSTSHKICTIVNKSER